MSCVSLVTVYTHNQTFCMHARIMYMFEVLAQQRLVIILMLFPVPTIEIHIAQSL